MRFDYWHDKLYQLFLADDGIGYAKAYQDFVQAGGRLMPSLAHHPLADDWRDFTLEQVGARLRHRRGFIYVAYNAMTPSFLKVGKTKLNPQARMKQLASEGVVGDFHCLAHWEVWDRHAAEAACHRALSAYPRHKEFFVTDWRTLLPLLAPVITSQNMLWTEIVTESFNNSIFSNARLE